MRPAGAGFTGGVTHRSTRARAHSHLLLLQGGDLLLALLDLLREQGHRADLVALLVVDLELDLEEEGKAAWARRESSHTTSTHTLTWRAFKMSGTDSTSSNSTSTTAPITWEHAEA